MDLISEEEKEAFFKLVAEKAERIAKKFNLPKSFGSPLFVPENGDFKNLEKANAELLQELRDWQTKNATQND